MTLIQEETGPLVLSEAPRASLTRRNVGLLVNAPVARRLVTSNGFFGDLVVNPAGEVLASLSDVCVDLALGKILYAIASSGGFMGKGEHLHPVPWVLLSRDSDSHSFVLNVEKTAFSAGPTVARAELQAGMSTALRNAVGRHYRVEP